VYIGSNVHPLFFQAIAIEVKSESKWKQLGELAMSTGKVFFLLNVSMFLVFSFSNWPNYAPKYPCPNLFELHI
jgi:hypothetical protein